MKYERIFITTNKTRLQTYHFGSVYIDSGRQSGISTMLYKIFGYVILPYGFHSPSFIKTNLESWIK